MLEPDIFKSTQSRIIVAVCVIALVVLIASPFRIPYAVSVPGKILCASEWIVAMNADGGIVTYVVDRASGITKNYSVAQFSRGDAVGFLLDPRIAGGMTIAAGDSIGVMRSSEVERELVRLKGELRTATASLAVTVTGEKRSIVEEAEQAMAHAKRQAEDLNAIFARQKLLFEKGLIAQQEYDLAERRASIAVIEVSIAEAKLRSVKTGAKPEQADLVRAQIKSLQNDIDVLQTQERGYRLTAPISGVVTQVGVGDTLLVVADTTDYVVVMPVPLQERDILEPEQAIQLYATELADIPSASMRMIDKTIHLLNGQQVVFATAHLNGMPHGLLNGLLARCSIQGTVPSAFEYLKRKLSTHLR